MNPAERIAIIERIARALAWADLAAEEKAVHLRRSGSVLDELEAAKEQHERIGWLFVELPPGDREEV